MPSEHVSVEEMIQRILIHVKECDMDYDDCSEVVELEIIQRTITDGCIQVAFDSLQLIAERSTATWEVQCACGWSVHCVEQDGIPAWEMIVRPDQGSEVNN